MSDQRKIRVCPHCHYVGEKLTTHVKHCKYSKDDPDKQDETLQLSNEIIRYAAEHVFVSERSLREFFHNKSSSYVQESWRLLSHLGHKVIPEGSKTNPVFRDKTKIPKKQPGWTTKCPEPKPKPQIQDAIHESSHHSAGQGDRLQQQVQGQEEEHEQEEVRSGRDEDDDDFEQSMGDSDGGDEDDDFEPDVEEEPWGDGETEKRWKYCGHRIKHQSKSLRKALANAEMTAAYNERHPENWILSDWYQYEIHNAMPKPKKGQQLKTLRNVKTTLLHYCAQFLLYCGTDGLQNSGCPKLTPKIYLNTKKYIEDWLSAARDCGCGYENLRTRKRALDRFYTWLRMKVGDEHYQTIQIILDSAEKSLNDLQTASKPERTKKQRQVLHPEEVLSIADVMSYKESALYKQQYNELKAEIEDPESQLRQLMQNYEGPLNGKKNNILRDKFQFLKGALCAMVCLEQAQRPSVMINLTVDQLRNSPLLDGVRVVYVFDHKSSGRNYNPAFFTIMPDEQWLFDAYDNFFRPLVCDDEDEEALWLRNTVGNSELNKLSENLSKWQLRVCGKQKAPATATAARTAIENMADMVQDLMPQGQREEITKYLSHSRRVVEDYYTRPHLEKVHRMSNNLRNLVQQAMNPVQEGQQQQQQQMPDVVAAPAASPDIQDTEHHDDEPQAAIPEVAATPRKGAYKGATRKSHPEFDMEAYEQEHGPVHWNNGIPSEQIVQLFLEPGHKSRVVKDWIRGMVFESFAKDVAKHEDTNLENIVNQCERIGAANGFWGKTVRGAAVKEKLIRNIQRYVSGQKDMSDGEEPEEPGEEPMNVEPEPGPSNAETPKQKRAQQPSIPHDDGPPAKKIAKIPRALKNLERTFEVTSPTKIARDIKERVKNTGWSDLVKMQEAEPFGNGVFVKDAVKKGTPLCHYGGKYMHSEDYYARLKKYKKENPDKYRRVKEYAQHMGTVGRQDWTIVAHKNKYTEGSFGHIINHSPHPQCVNVLEDVHPMRRDDGIKVNVLVFRANKDIPKGTQLLRDYGDTYSWPDDVVPICPNFDA